MYITETKSDDILQQKHSQITTITSCRMKIAIVAGFSMDNFLTCSERNKLTSTKEALMKTVPLLLAVGT